MLVDKEGSHNFRPYSYTPRHISKVQLFEEHNKIRLVPKNYVSIKAPTLLEIVAPDLLLTNCEWREDLAVYNTNKY